MESESKTFSELLKEVSLDLDGKILYNIAPNTRTVSRIATNSISQGAASTLTLWWLDYIGDAVTAPNNFSSGITLWACDVIDNGNNYSATEAPRLINLVNNSSLGLVESVLGIDLSITNTTSLLSRGGVFTNAVIPRFITALAGGTAGFINSIIRPVDRENAIGRSSESVCHLKVLPPHTRLHVPISTMANNGEIINYLGTSAVAIASSTLLNPNTVAFTNNSWLGTSNVNGSAGVNYGHLIRVDLTDGFYTNVLPTGVIEAASVYQLRTNAATSANPVCTGLRFRFTVPVTTGADFSTALGTSGSWQVIAVAKSFNGSTGSAPTFGTTVDNFGTYSFGLYGNRQSVNVTTAWNASTTSIEIEGFVNVKASLGFLTGVSFYIVQSTASLSAVRYGIPRGFFVAQTGSNDYGAVMLGGILQGTAGSSYAFHTRMLNLASLPPGGRQIASTSIESDQVISGVQSLLEGPSVTHTHI